MKPKFKFTANSAEPNDKSGIAVWQYTVLRCGVEVETFLQHSFDTFDAAYQIDTLIAAAWSLGEASGYAACESRVLNCLKA